MSGDGGAGPAGPSDSQPQNARAVTGFDEVPAIIGRLRALKTQMDGALEELRGWGRAPGADGPTTRAAAPAEASRGLGDTVGGLAHHFNNSLAVIMSYTDLLVKNATDETTVRRLAVIRQVAHEAAGTVRLLHQFLARRPEGTLGPVALQAVVADALALTEPRWRTAADRRGIRVVITRELEGAPPVEGNYIDLREAFTQLLWSALDALPEGGELGVRAWNDAASGLVVTHLRDTGAGPRQLGGTVRLVERQGGSLRVLPGPGPGTTVELRLPPSPYQIIPTGEEPLPRPAEESRRILLVDDDPRLLRALTDLLEDYGHTVRSAASGAEALAVLDPDAIDLVVTDLGMPGMTGWEVAAEVKRRDPKMPVYLMTGWGEEVSADERSRYVDRVLAKPVSAEALLSPLAGVGMAALPAAGPSVSFQWVS